MDDKDLRLIDVLSKTHSISRTADKIYISQSTISKRIKQIEQELGIDIILRSRQGVHFTPEGEAVLKYARESLARMESMRQEISHGSGTVTGTLRCGVSINYARYRLAEPLNYYREHYPLVKTNIKTANSHALFAALLENEIDIAILRGEYQWSDKKILLEREPMCLIVNSKDADKPLEEIPQIIQYDTDMEWQIAQWMRENNLSRHKNYIEVNSTSTCMKLVKNGLAGELYRKFV